MKERLEEFKNDNKLLAAERLEQRTNYDIEMLEDMIVAAYSDCLSQIEKVEAENMPNMPMGF